MYRKPVPVTIVTGFLGAGKTSLINAMLTQAHGLRLAVLVNDFGAINIDAALIAGNSDDVVSLQNGCICCSLADGLLSAVANVLRRSDPPDAIVIETSGVSDPLEIARILCDPELQIHAPLDGVVTLVDAVTVGTLEGAALDLIKRQIAAADIVLLNKSDLAAESALRAVESWVHNVVPTVRTVRTCNGVLPLDILLGRGGTAVSEISRFACDEPGNQYGSSNHGEAFESVLIDRKSPIPLRTLHGFLSRLPRSVYRVKGIVDIAEKRGFRCNLQATGARATLTVSTPWDGVRPVSQIVIIGDRGSLDVAAFKSQLSA
jgi:G3E family GTPase